MKLIKAALVAVSCSIALVGCGTYNHPFAKKTAQVQDAADNVANNEKNLAQQLVSSTYHFKFDNTELSEGAKAELDQFAQYLSQNPNSKIHVEGYTDIKGKPAYNVALGLRRAQSIAEYLKQQGVNESQIETRSFGADKPVELGDTPDALARNRRAVVFFEVENELA